MFVWLFYVCWCINRICSHHFLLSSSFLSSFLFYFILTKHKSIYGHKKKLYNSPYGSMVHDLTNGILQLFVAILNTSSNLSTLTSCEWSIKLREFQWHKIEIYQILLITIYQSWYKLDDELRIATKYCRFLFDKTMNQVYVGLHI